MPPERTFCRLFAALSAGKHTTGSARTRQSVAKRPARPFGTVTALRPGEWTQIDSTPLNVRVVLDNGETDRVELPWKHLRSAPAPFGEPAWQHARRILAERGQDPGHHHDGVAATSSCAGRAGRGDRGGGAGERGGSVSRAGQPV
jgi:hypothetical protein